MSQHLNRPSLGILLRADKDDPWRWCVIARSQGKSHIKSGLKDIVSLWKKFHINTNFWLSSSDILFSTTAYPIAALEIFTKAVEGSRKRSLHSYVFFFSPKVSNTKDWSLLILRSQKNTIFEQDLNVKFIKAQRFKHIVSIFVGYH